MAVRSSMAALISRVRLLINDPAGASQVFADQDIQDVMDDGSRADYYNLALEPKPIFVAGSIQWLDYFTTLGDWEDDAVLKQYLINVVTPSLAEPITGHWQFATTTLPPVYITGKTYDVYRAAADLLERWAARYVTRFDFTSDAQSFRVSQVPAQLQALASTYRKKQRASHAVLRRTDVESQARSVTTGLGPLEIDYMAKG